MYLNCTAMILILSNYNIISAKYKVVLKQLEEKTAFVEKHCLQNKSMQCKQKWFEIKVLHKKAEKLEKELNNYNSEIQDAL